MTEAMGWIYDETWMWVIKALFGVHKALCDDFKKFLFSLLLFISQFAIYSGLIVQKEKENLSHARHIGYSKAE